MTRRTPAQYDFGKQLFDELLLPTTGAGRRSTYPRGGTVKHIDIHHMTIHDSSDGAALRACVATWKTREASAHYGIDNNHIAQFVYDNRMAWGNANGTANREGIIIEHANSTLGPKWEISDTTIANSVRLNAELHVTHKLGRPKSTGFGTGGTIRTHQSFYATSCPGPYFKKIWTSYVKKVQAEYDRITKPEQKPKTMTIRPATYNLPAGDKIPNPAARAKAGAKLVLSGRPDFIGFQELEPIKKPGAGSDFAHAVDAGLGAGWSPVRPTRPLNENYLEYNTARFSVVTQYEDSILESASGGRHILRVVLKHKPTGNLVAVGVTQLVNDPANPSAAVHKAREADRQRQAVDAMASMKAVAAKHGGCPIIILGDMNTSADLKGFVDGGLQNIRHKAGRKTNADKATYTNIAKDTPSTNPDWIIDHIYVPKEWAANGYALALGTTSAGKFTKPRPSDHVPVIGSVTSK